MGFKSLFLVLALVSITFAAKTTLNMLKLDEVPKTLQLLRNHNFTVEEYAMIFHPAFVGLISVFIGLLIIHIYSTVS